MAHRYTATVAWRRGDEDFLDRRYSRAHAWSFDGGVTVPASSSPLVVKVPLSRLDAVDPEEALVASASSCHMLFFLDFVSRAGFRVDAYEDAAEGEVGKRDDGRIGFLSITLHPAVTFVGAAPSPEALAELHHKAHEACFIANSLNFPVAVEAPEPVVV